MDISNIWTGSELHVFPDSYVVVDLETSGIIAGRNSIIEISAVKVVDGAVSDQFSSLIHRDKPLNSKVVNLTGITTDMLRSEPSELPVVLQSFSDFICCITQFI